MPKSVDKTKTVVRGIKLAKMFIKLVSRKMSATPNFNPQGTEVAADITLNVVQTIGAGAIVGIFLLYRMLMARFGKGDQVEVAEKRALFGFALGLNLANTTGKALPKGLLSTIWNITIGLSLGLITSVAFTLVPRLAKIQPDKNTFDLVKLGLKFGAAILTGFATLATNFISGIGFIYQAIAVATTFILGAVLGGSLLPKIAAYFEKKGDTDFADRMQTGFYWGSILGASAGAFLGSCVFPGVGTFIGAVIGATACSIALTLTTLCCRPIYRYLESKEMLFGAKAGGVIGGGIGGLIFTFLIPIPVLGTSAGVAIGSFIGTVAGACISKIATHVKSIISDLSRNRKEAPATSTDSPYLNKYKLGLSSCTLFGGLIGGLLGGPIAAMAGATIGAVVGLVAAGIYQTVHRYRKRQIQPVSEETSPAVKSTESSTSRVFSALIPQDVYNKSMPLEPLTSHENVTAGNHEIDYKPSQPIAIPKRSARNQDTEDDMLFVNIEPPRMQLLSQS